MSEWIQFSVSQNWHMTTWLSMTALITRQVCAEDAAYEKKEASMKSSSPTLLPSGGQKENCWDVAIYIPSFMFLWHTTQSRFTFFSPAQRDNCVSSFRSHYVLIVIIYMLPGGCAIIKMLFESFKRLQLSQAQNLVYIQLLARKSLTAQQFISNGPKKPMHSQKQKCEEKCQPLWYKYWVAFKIWLNNAPGISITVGLWSHL